MAALRSTSAGRVPTLAAKELWLDVISPGDGYGPAVQISDGPLTPDAAA